MAFGWDDAAKAAPIIGGAIMGIGAGRRQIKQQQKLNELSLSASKEMADYNKSKELEMWNATNVGAQIKHMKDAGMSVSAMYGGSGGGGTTTGGSSGGMGGGSADGEVARQGMGIQSGMALAQMALLEAQTKKTEAETGNILGGVKEKLGADVEATKWSTELSKKLNTDEQISNVLQRSKNETNVSDILGEKNLAEWEAFKAAGFSRTKDGEGWIWNDENSPIVKSIRAGMEKVSAELQNARATNNVINAEAAIKRFEADLTKQGIPAGSPWYIKIVGDLLKKVGINLTGDTAEKIR